MVMQVLRLHACWVSRRTWWELHGRVIGWSREGGKPISILALLSGGDEKGWGHGGCMYAQLCSNPSKTPETFALTMSRPVQFLSPRGSVAAALEPRDYAAEARELLAPLGLDAAAVASTPDEQADEAAVASEDDTAVVASDQHEDAAVVASGQHDAAVVASDQHEDAAVVTSDAKQDEDPAAAVAPAETEVAGGLGAAAAVAADDPAWLQIIPTHWDTGKYDSKALEALKSILLQLFPGGAGEPAMRDLDFVEAFAGQAAVSRGLELLGFIGRSVDQSYNEAHDILSPSGFGLLASFLARLRPGGIFWAAPPLPLLDLFLSPQFWEGYFSGGAPEVSSDPVAKRAGAAAPHSLRLCAESWVPFHLGATQQHPDVPVAPTAPLRGGV